MNIWAIADLHLSFGVPDKKMDIFGEHWENHAEKIAAHWRESIQPDDLVLLPGDISWAMTLEEVKTDLEWIHALPGTKVMIRGNHDYWWPSMKKLQSVLPPSIHAIYNNSITINDISIAGTRFWDSPEYSFGSLYNSPPPVAMTPENIKIYERELDRLEMSLKAMKPAKFRLAMTHYPPIGLNLERSRAASLFEQYNVSAVCFGHLHFPREKKEYFGSARGVSYYLTAADFLDFRPLLIAT